MNIHEILKTLTKHVGKTKNSGEAFLFYVKYIQPIKEYFGGDENVKKIDLLIVNNENIQTILNDINELREIGAFIAFEHGDVMENMDRNNLRESAERFYEVLRKIEDRLKDEIE